MTIRNIFVSISLVMVSLTLYGFAFAHGTKRHGSTSPADAQMKKLHAIMPMFSVASARLEAALENGDVVTVEAETRKIIAALPDLKKSKPHKNIKQRRKFVEIATKLEQLVTSTLVMAKKGDFNGAKATFKKIEEACAACHAKFRD